MNYIKLISVSLLIIFISSCSDRKGQNDQGETPDAFQDKELISDISSWKRGYYNLVEDLYSEIKEKNEELQTIDKNIEQIAEDNYKDTKEIYKFFSNNKNYYTDASSYTASLQDSILKNKIDLLLLKSEENFNAASINLNLLKETLKNKEQELSDLYKAMKIVITLHTIENYQINEIPDTSAANNLIDRYENLIETVNIKIKN